MAAERISSIGREDINSDLAKISKEDRAAMQARPVRNVDVAASGYDYSIFDDIASGGYLFNVSGSGPTGLHLGPVIPGYPRPPASVLQKGDGSASGQFGTEAPTSEDYRVNQRWTDRALAAGMIGYDHAAENMLHYLSAQGTVKSLDVNGYINDNKMVYDLFSENMNGQYSEALSFYKSNFNGSRAVFTAQTKWFDVTADYKSDWYYAVGSASMSLTTRFQFEPKGQNIYLKADTRVDLFDRYNWDGGKSVTLGSFAGYKFKVSDTELGRLNMVGLAKNYEMRGSAQIPTGFGKFPK